MAGSATCCAMKQPNPERLVVTEGIPITVHSAGEGGREGGRKGEGEGVGYTKEEERE